jgi:hypothetical protein
MKKNNGALLSLSGQLILDLYTTIKLLEEKFKKFLKLGLPSKISTLFTKWEL